MMSSEPWYQIYGTQPIPAYVSAIDGRAQSCDGRRLMRRRIASLFLGGASVRQTDYLTDFNQEYVNIFRILPVFRFDVHDGVGTRVYVSTTTGTVTRHTDDEKQFEANVFFAPRIRFHPRPDDIRGYRRPVSAMIGIPRWPLSLGWFCFS
jgi:hypothetical protein